MKAGIIFSGTGPILILTSYATLDDYNLIQKLEAKGIKKYLAFELDEAIVKEKYGKHYNIIMNDLHQTDDLRVLDYDGHHVFYNFPFKDFGEPIFKDQTE